jgi:hypothetical protein
MKNPPLWRKQPDTERIVAWFSCGAASAVACKLLLSRRQIGQEIAIARIWIADEHPDNDRFAADCEAWFGEPIIQITSSDYPNGCFEVWTKRRYMSGIAGAICTTELKKSVRFDFEREWQPDKQAFGFTMEESARAERFRANNPDVRLLTPLIDAGLSKGDCFGLLERAGIALPAMYALGFANNNCIGCVKAQSPRYWNRVRQHFPERFDRIAALADELGAKLVKVNETRVALSALPVGATDDQLEIEAECSLLCVIADQDMQK